MQLGHGFFFLQHFEQICAVCKCHIDGVPDRPERARRLRGLGGDARFRVCCCCLGDVGQEASADPEYRDRWIEWAFENTPECFPGWAENR